MTGGTALNVGASQMPRRNIDELLITYLAAGKTVRETARLVGCGEATVRRRLADPAFRRAVQQTRRGMIEAICGEIRRAAALAVSTLEALFTSDEPSIRLRAADAILHHLHALHREMYAEPEEPLAKERQVVVKWEIVNSDNFDPAPPSSPPSPPNDKPYRIDLPSRP